MYACIRVNKQAIERASERALIHILKLMDNDELKFSRFSTNPFVVILVVHKLVSNCNLVTATGASLVFALCRANSNIYDSSLSKQSRCCKLTHVYLK